MTDGELLAAIFPESAHSLDIILERVGNFSRLLNMSAPELTALGLDDKTAQKLTLLPEAARRYFTSEHKEGEMLTDSDGAAEFLAPYFTGKTHESAVFCTLGGRAEVIAVHEIDGGSRSEINIDPGELIRIALTDGARGAILAHNHPCGFAVPSQADITLTRDILFLLRDIRVALCDHIIFAGNDFCSMAKTGRVPELSYSD